MAAMCFAVTFDPTIWFAFLDPHSPRGGHSSYRLFPSKSPALSVYRTLTWPIHEAGILRHSVWYPVHTLSLLVGNLADEQ